MKVLKFFVVFFAIVAILAFSYGFLSENEVLTTMVDYYKRTPTKLINNDYEKSSEITFVKLTDDFTANNKDEIMNMLIFIFF